MFPVLQERALQNPVVQRIEEPILIIILPDRRRLMTSQVDPIPELIVNQVETLPGLQLSVTQETEVNLLVDITAVATEILQEVVQVLADLPLRKAVLAAEVRPGLEDPEGQDNFFEKITFLLK